jgi:hypothetical protein
MPSSYLDSISKRIVHMQLAATRLHLSRVKPARPKLFHTSNSCSSTVHTVVSDKVTSSSENWFVVAFLMMLQVIAPVLSSLLCLTRKDLNG